jgi:transcriptional regulator with XRE-family HTH domain
MLPLRIVAVAINSIANTAIIGMLQSHRKAAGMTQWDLARALRTDQSRISKFEHQRTRPRHRDHLRICRAIGLEPETPLRSVDFARAARKGGSRQGRMLRSPLDRQRGAAGGRVGTTFRAFARPGLAGAESPNLEVEAGSALRDAEYLAAARSHGNTLSVIEHVVAISPPVPNGSAFALKLRRTQP